MASYDLDEEIQRILDEGSASARPAELAEFQQAMQADMVARGTTPEAEASLMPRGTRVVFDEAPEVIGPARKPLMQRPALPEVPSEKVIDATQQPPDDIEEAYARAKDRDNQARQLFERGGRELVAGLTRTEVQPIATPSSDYFGRLMGKRKDADARRRQDNADLLARRRLDNEGERIDAYGRQVAANEESARNRAESGAARLTYEQTRDERNDKTKNRALQIQEDKLKQAGKPKPAGPKLMPKGFPAGWELEGSTQPTPKQGEEFEGLVFADEKMRGLTREMRGLLAKAGSGRVLPGPERSRLKQLATEIQIEGKNIAGLGALSGPDMGLMNAIAADPTSVGSFINDLPGLLTGLDAWGANSVAAKAKSLGARRIGQAGAAKGPVKMKFPDGSVHEVTPDDMAEARARGAVPNG